MTRFSTFLSFVMAGIFLGLGIGATAGGLTFIVILILESELRMFAFSIVAIAFGGFIGALLGGINGFVLGEITALLFHKTAPRLYLPLVMISSVIVTHLILWVWSLKYPDAPLSPMVVAYPSAIFGAWCLGQWHIANLKSDASQAI